MAQGFAVGPDRLTFLTKVLGLTTPQQEQAKSILSDEESAVKPLIDQMKEASDELVSAAKTADGDIDGAAAQIGTISGQIVALDAKPAAKVYQLLTSSQKQKFDQLPPPLLATPSLLGPGPGMVMSRHFETVAVPGPAQ
jgi:Spy/CpxP family protein refolding chaperone